MRSQSHEGSWPLFKLKFGNGWLISKCCGSHCKKSIPVFNSNSNSNSRVFNSNSIFNSTNFNSNSNSNSGIGIGIDQQFQFQNWIDPNPGNGSNLGFLVISRKTHRGNGLKFCMLMYLDHLQNWLVLGHGLLTFVILAVFWLSETGQIWGFRAFPGECMEGMAWNMVCWCILTTFRTGKIMVTVCRFFLFWCYFALVKRVKFGVSRHFGRALWIFLIMVTLWLKLVIFGVSGHYLENLWK